MGGPDKSRESAGTLTDATCSFGASIILGLQEHNVLIVCYPHLDNSDFCQLLAGFSCQTIFLFNLPYSTGACYEPYEPWIKW